MKHPIFSKIFCKPLIMLGIVATFSACGSSSSTPSNLTSASTAGTLTIQSSASSVSVSGSAQFSASGGVPPYSFVNLSGVGTLNTSTGLYQAPSYATTVQIEVMDSTNAQAIASLSVGTVSTGSTGNGGTTTTTSTLGMYASTSSITAGSQVSFTVFGGQAPYTFRVISGSGSLSVTGATGNLTDSYNSSASDSGSIQIEVTDSSYPSQSAFSQVTVNSSSNSTSSGGSSCSTTPIVLLTAQYSGTKSITSFSSPFGGNCSLSAHPDTNDTVTCNNLAIPTISSYYYSCEGGKIYSIGLNGSNFPGTYAGIGGNGNCSAQYVSSSQSVNSTVGSLQIDARSGGSVVIYGVPSCN